MSNFIACLIVGVLFLSACHNAVNTNENKTGIDSAVIAQIDTAYYTKVEWEDTLKNFGMVKEGDSVFIKFRFKNTGEKLLFLSKVQASCGCTVASYPRHAILPGKGGEVMATFTSKGHPGFIRKTITVTTNTVNKTKQLLSLIGEVRDSLPHSPLRI